MRWKALTYATNGGELSRRLEGRSDLDGIYDRGFAVMFNFLATVEGPAVKRPGTLHIALADPTAVRLERFIFNTTQAYVLELAEEKIRFYTNGGRIELAPGVPFEVDVPYTAAQWPNVSFEQSYDRIYLSHPAHPPGVLSRVGAVDFEYAELTLENGPFKATNTDKTRTIAVTSADSTFEVDQSATIEATGHSPFDANHVGSLILFEATGFTDVKAWEPQCKLADISTGDFRRSDGKVYELTDKGSNERTGTIQPTHTEGREWDGSGQTMPGTTDDKSGAQWEYKYDRFGIGRITAVADSGEATITVTRRLPDMLADGSYKWAFGAFSDFEQWPHLGKLWGSRLAFFKSVELFASVVGDYGGGRANFAPFNDSGELAPDQAFRRPIAIADPPLWAHADKDYLLCGSASQEVVIGVLNRAEGLSSGNIRADAQSSYGSSPVWPINAGASLIFAQRGGRKVREMEYTYEKEKFAGANINIYSRHVTRGGVTSLAFQQESEEMLWATRRDGLLLAHPHSAEQATKGFSRCQLGGGGAGWVTVVPSDDGSRDDLWILASLNGTRHVLKLADYWDEDLAANDDELVAMLKDAVFVDYAVQYDGEEEVDGEPLGTRQHFTTGLTHLEGETVRVLADGLTIDGLTVTGGELTLPRPATKVTIGLPYQARLKPMRPEIRGGPSAQGLLAKVKALWARLIDTTNLNAIDSDGNSNRMFAREPGNTQLTTPRIFNGDSERVPVGHGSSRDPAPEFISDDAGPCTISIFNGEYELEDPRG